MNKKVNKLIRYLIIRNGNVAIGYTDDFIRLMDDEYHYFFDSCDDLFDSYPDIRVFVKDESLFSEKPTVYYYDDQKLMTTFNGTVFFAKLGTTKVRSLSEKEVSFLLKNLNRRCDGCYEISNVPALKKELSYYLPQD